MLVGLVTAALSCVPGLGPFAGVIARLAVALSEAEAQEAYKTVKALVHEAEAHKDWSGSQKFEWVLLHSSEQIAKDQLKVLENTLQLFIEMEVASLNGLL
jgi:hypothetical protein